ncbi:MAG: tetratricopeptide repeat protein [Nitrososphaera sp.]
MSQPVLSEAIALIKAGRKTEAQQLLETFLESDPHHIIAWLWYAETWTTASQKTQVLELGLQYNPDSEKIKNAVLRLKPGHRPKKKPARGNVWIIASVIGLQFLEYAVVRQCF